MQPASLARHAPKGLARPAGAVAVIAAGATHLAGSVAQTCTIAALLAAVTVRIMLIDLKLRQIDRRDSAAIFVLGICDTLVNSEFIGDDLLASTATCAIVALSLALVRIAYRAVRHVEGIGSGDIELAAASGFLLALEELATSLWLGAAFSGIFVLLRLARRPARRISRIRAPYGCFLAAAMLLVWLLRTMTGSRALS